MTGNLPSGPAPAGRIVKTAVIRGAAAPLLGHILVVCAYFVLVDDAAASDLARAIINIAVLAVAALGGYVAGRGAPADPLPNGALAGAVGFALVLAGLMTFGITGLSTVASILSLIFVTLTMATCGMVGALIFQVQRNKREQR